MKEEDGEEVEEKEDGGGGEGGKGEGREDGLVVGKSRRGVGGLGGALCVGTHTQAQNGFPFITNASITTFLCSSTENESESSSRAKEQILDNDKFMEQQRS